MIDRRTFLRRSSAALLASALPTLPCLADAGPIPGGKVLFGYPPGGDGTLMARGIAGLMARSSPAYTVENIDGRNTRLANEMLRNAPADGSVLLQAQSTSLTLLPSVYKALGYDPLNDFTPLALTGEFSLSLTVGKMVPAEVTTLAHYLAWRERNPDVPEVGFSIYGSQGHLATLIMARANGIIARPQPYKGSSALVKDLLNGNLAAGFTAAGNTDRDAWRNGSLRSLGVTRAERLAYWPSVPTLKEQGVEPMDIGVWYGWFAHAQTPPPLLKALRDKLHEVQAMAEYKQLQAQLLLGQIDMTPEQIRQRIIDETARFRALVSTYNLKQSD